VKIPGHQLPSQGYRLEKRFVIDVRHWHVGRDSRHEEDLRFVDVSNPAEDSLVEQCLTNRDRAVESQTPQDIGFVQRTSQDIGSELLQLGMAGEGPRGEELQHLGTETDGLAGCEFEGDCRAMGRLLPSPVAGVEVPRPGHTEVGMEHLPVVKVKEEMFAAGLDIVDSAVNDRLGRHRRGARLGGLDHQTADRGAEVVGGAVDGVSLGH
jgi:hypothetical protein